jgi:hypothetical protein
VSADYDAVRDAAALIRASLDRDDEAARVVLDNADLLAVVAALAGAFAELLRVSCGDQGASEFLDGWQGRVTEDELGEAG